MFRMPFAFAFIFMISAGCKNPESVTYTNYVHGTDMEATCSGTKSCSACKNCKYCKHCSKEGGTCGVCK